MKHELEFCEVFKLEIVAIVATDRGKPLGMFASGLGPPSLCLLHLYVKLYVSLGYHPHGGAVVRVPISMCAWICSLLCPRVFLPLLMWPAKATCSRCGLSFLVRLGLSDTMSAQPLRRHHSPSAT